MIGPLKPVSRRELIRRLIRLGFSPPEAGAKHQVMRRKAPYASLVLPNPHEGDIGIGLLNQLLKQAGVSREEWESVA